VSERPFGAEIQLFETFLHARQGDLTSYDNDIIAEICVTYLLCIGNLRHVGGIIIMKSLRPRTLTFLMRDTQILLGLKKKGFGKNYLLGIGGKVEKAETIEDAAKREVAEEINVILTEFHKVGVLNFYFPHIEDESWDQQVHIFTTTKWVGEPQESEEIKPEWVNKKDIPYAKMWDDAQYWLPQILTGQSIEGEFVFNKELKVADYNIKLSN
jgi:8-oxo-dGTP diphosphatase